MPQGNKDASTSWGEVAQWYDELVSQGEGTYQSELILPKLRKLLALKKDEKVLDLGCGQGFFSFEMWREGASVLGSDISKELIEIAKKRIPKEVTGYSLQFKVAPAHQLPFIQNGAMDTIVCVLALQNMRDMPGVLRECARVLKSGGRLCLVLSHPAFRVPKASDWGWDEKQKVEYRRVEKYMSTFSAPIRMHPGQSQTAETITFHWPLTELFDAFLKAGFLTKKLDEWTSHRRVKVGPRAKALDAAKREIPLFLYIETVKIKLP